MKQKRGRPQGLLTKMRGKARDEIRNAIKYGSPAWRVIRLRELLGGAQVLPDNYLSAQLAQHNARMAAHERERKTIFRKHRTHEERLRALREMRHKPVVLPLHLCLWRELCAQIEQALLRKDDEWLNELAKAMRGEALPDDRAQFALKVLHVYERIMWWPVNGDFPANMDLRATPIEAVTHVTAGDVYKELKVEKVLELPGRDQRAVKVEGHIFENRNRAMDAIHDVETQIGFVLARVNVQARGRGQTARCLSA
jgi:hypothetical protein